MSHENYNGRAVLVEDDHSSQEFWKQFLVKNDFRVDTCDSLHQMKKLLDCYHVDIVLIDIDLEHENGFEGIPYIVSNFPYSKVFVLSEEESVEQATHSIKLGATDYFVKSSCPDAALSKLINSLTQEHTSIPNLSNKYFIGESDAHLELCSKIQRIKDVDTTILILGESGTGKEVVARTLHHQSERSHQRFEAINCGAIPEQLLESELFGHKKGAFTDATDNRKGIFELCSKGTLLLDEIGDMPLSLQVKLLRVLESKEVTPVGSSSSIQVNTRILAATHQDLKELVKSGKFREDLYYRLSIIPIELSPLRERKEDIPLLANSFINTFNEKFDKEINPLTQDLSQRLMSYDWPGNIRELKNAVERSVVLAKDSDLDIEGLFSQAVKKQPSENFENVSFDEMFQVPLSEAKQLFEKIYIKKLLLETQGNISLAAEKCGRYRSDIYRLFDKYQIDPKAFR